MKEFTIVNKQSPEIQTKYNGFDFVNFKYSKSGLPLTIKMKKKIFIFIFLANLFFVNSYSQQDVNGWYWLNGQPTGVQLNWVQIVNAANIYAVGDRGMFMKSADGGDTWTLNSQIGSPDNSSTGNLATRSLNDGWFFNANTGIVGGQSLITSNGRISRTTDGGNTFTYIQYNDTGGTINKFSFINATTGYFCGGTMARFFKTTNGGLNWTDQSYGGEYFATGTPSNTYNSICAIDTSHIILGTDSRKIYTHFPGQDSAWKTKFLPGTVNAIITDIIFKDANTGYACGNPNYFAYTTNGGNTWTQSLASSTVAQRDLVYDAGVLYMGGNYNYIYKSTNNGITWDSIYFHDGSNVNQPSPFVIYCIGVKDNDIAVVGANGICNLSNDGGTTWRNKNYSVNPSITTYTSIVDPCPKNVLCGHLYVGPGGGGNLLYSTNNGTNWTTQTTSHTTSIFGIDFVDSASTIGFICGGSAVSGIGEFSKTTNGGNTWNLLSLPSPMSTYQLNNLDFVNANTGYVAGFSSPFTPAYIFKTTDGGATWVTQSLETNPNGSVVNVRMINADSGYALGNSGSALYTTVNGGTNWIKNTNSYITSTSWSNMFVLTKDIIYLCGSGTGSSPGATKKVIRSTDGGANWTDLTGNLLYTFTAYRTNWLNLKHGIVSGTNGYMAKTTNGGLNWTESNPGFSTTVDCAFPEKNEWYTVSDRNGSYQVGRKYDNITSISVNVTIPGLVSDSAKIELHNSTPPYALAGTAKELANINGYATYEFYSVPSGSYYIVEKHGSPLESRITSETWSSSPIAMSTGGNYEYDFSTESDFEISNLYAKGSIPIKIGMQDTISFRIVNYTMGNFLIHYTVKINKRGNGDNLFTSDPINILLTTPDTIVYYGLPKFYSPTDNLIIVEAVPGAFLNDNFSSVGDTSKKQYCQNITNDTYNYADPCLNDNGGFGFQGSTGNIVAGFRNNDSSSIIIGALQQSFFDSVGGGNIPYNIVIYGDSTNSKPGKLLYKSPNLLTPAGTGSPQVVTYNLNVTIPQLSRFYVGYRQTSGSSIKTSFQSEIPIRKKSFFFTGQDTTNWYDFSDSSKNFRMDMAVIIKSKTLNLKLVMQGLYNAVDLSGRRVRDTVEITIRKSYSPYDTIQSRTVFLDSAYNGSYSYGFTYVQFTSLVSGTPYYIVIKNRKTLESWSNPVSTSGDTLKYDFTTSTSQTYGNNAILTNGVPSIYSGDITSTVSSMQDGFIDLADVNVIFNDAAVFTFGPNFVTDLNLDGFVDLTDQTIVYNNSTIFVQRIAPPGAKPMEISGSYQKSETKQQFKK